MGVHLSLSVPAVRLGNLLGAIRRLLLGPFCLYGCSLVFLGVVPSQLGDSASLSGPISGEELQRVETDNTRCPCL